jgi:hypothetical protein
MPAYVLEVTTWTFEGPNSAAAVRDLLWPALQADPDYENPIVDAVNGHTIHVTTTFTTPGSAVNAMGFLSGRIADASQDAGVQYPGLREISATT